MRRLKKFSATPQIPIWLSVALVLLLCSSTTSAGSAICSIAKSCPQTEPCCSEYGYCSTGTACLGGCQPYWSYSPQSCAPQPVCSNGNFTFSNTSTVLLPYDTYNNDATAGNWTLDSGMAFVNEDDELVLTLSKTNGGTRLSSTRAFLYGNVSARLQTGRWEGVIAAWITMSGVRDEIDWEFVGNDTTVGQSSYYWQGNTADFKHSSNISITDSYSSWNDYGLSWLPDSLSWTVNDVVVRILYKNHTFNNVTNVYEYPQTPSRLQLGLWASGLKSEAESTIQWGGGLVDWNTPDYTKNGHFSMFVQNVQISCNGANSSSGLSYTYGANSTDGVASVFLTNTSTQIYSEDASGLNMSAGATANNTANATYGLIIGVQDSSAFITQDALERWRFGLVCMSAAAMLLL